MEYIWLVGILSVISSSTQTVFDTAPPACPTSYQPPKLPLTLQPIDVPLPKHYENLPICVTMTTNGFAASGVDNVCLSGFKVANVTETYVGYVAVAMTNGTIANTVYILTNVTCGVIRMTFTDVPTVVEGAWIGHLGSCSSLVMCDFNVIGDTPDVFCWVISDKCEPISSECKNQALAMLADKGIRVDSHYTQPMVRPTACINSQQCR